MHNIGSFLGCCRIRTGSAGEAERLNLYPDPEGRRLRRKLAERYGVGEENVFLSNGSDDILNFAFMAFCDRERPVAFPDISYGFYPVFARLHGEGQAVQGLHLAVGFAEVGY